MKKLFRNIAIFAMTALVLGLTGVIYILVIASQAPELKLENIRPDAFMTTVYDKDENTILELYGEEANRVYAKLDEIPDTLENAFIAIEDSRFESHHGVDPKGILRSIGKILTTGKASQGGSTITQQLIKNNVFTEWTNENLIQKVNRKIQEQYLAIKLETQVDKDWILENYLNTINLGAGAWGVKQAAQRYFDKPLMDLTLSECSVLAGITKSPTKYNPISNPEDCRDRQVQVLNAMLRQAMINQEEYDEALADDVYTRIAENHSVNSIHVFSYFEDALIQQVHQDLMDQLKLSSTEAWDKIYRGGLSIYSTQDSHIQGFCESAVNNDSLFSSDAECSIVVLDVHTGAVRGIVGGRGKKEGSLVLNRATDILRQPGSTIKILAEYAAAMDNGSINLGTVLNDAPTSYFDGTAIHNANGEYSGRVTVREAIAKSLNTIAFQVFDQVGMEENVRYLKNFGITTLTEQDENEALALGGTYGGVTNLEMTAAYNAIANDGVYTKPYYYTYVLDHNGEVLLTSESESHRVISVKAAELLTKAMQDVLSGGTGTLAYFDGPSIAGKTGTTTNLRDTWLIGYSPAYTCGVWGGYDDNREQESSAYVKYLWKSVMSSIPLSSEESRFSFDTEFEHADICGKCGQRAVYDVCDRTVQGDVIVWAEFAKGEAPEGYCQCHDIVTICTESNHRAGDYCPEECKEKRIYLKEGSYGTYDSNYVTPERYKEECELHVYVEPEEPESPELDDFMTDMWDFIFGGSRRERRKYE